MLKILDISRVSEVFKVCGRYTAEAIVKTDEFKSFTKVLIRSFPFINSGEQIFFCVLRFKFIVITD